MATGFFGEFISSLSSREVEDETKTREVLNRLSEQMPRRVMILISLLQGFMLLGLYRAYKHDAVITLLPQIMYPLWAISLLLPLMLLLSLNRDNIIRAVTVSGGFVTIVAALLIYVGYQAGPADAFPVDGLIATTVFTVFLCSYQVVMYVQRYAGQLSGSYLTLFILSWRNLLIPIFAAAFTLLCAGILLLWGALFKSIGVEFFSYLFNQDWFICPVLSTAFGVGVIVFRSLDQIVDSITHFLQSAIGLLLPILTVIAITYVATLLVVGVELLFQTGWGSGYMLWLIALELFFINAVYQDGSSRTDYSPAIHKVVALGILVLLIPVVVSAYGLYLRINEYGFTVSRGHGVIVWLLLSLFVVGYSYLVVRLKGQWYEGLGQINKLMNVVMICVLLALNSPLLDLRKLSLNDQLERLSDGRTTPENFDVSYVHRHLVRGGYEALQSLSETSDNKTLLANIENRNYYGGYTEPQKVTPEDLAQRLDIQTKEEVPAGFLELIKNKRYITGTKAVLYSLDMNEDGKDELLLFNFRSGLMSQGFFFQLVDGRWRMGRLNLNYQQKIDLSQTEALMTGQKPAVVKPRFNNVEVGTVELLAEQDLQPIEQRGFEIISSRKEIE